MSWTFVEPCCGAAAITLHLLGARRALVPYQGSKWSIRREIAAELGVDGPPHRVILSDASCWASVVATVLTAGPDVVGCLRPLVEQGSTDPRGLYARLSAKPVPDDRVERAATLLWLQRMNFSAKAVGDVAGRWKVHGLSHSSAFGKAATASFGAVRPLGPALLASVSAAPQVPIAVAERGLAEPRVDGPTVVLLDPPYANTTGYPSGSLSRGEVVECAMAWYADGAKVRVCEAEPIRELVALGWRAKHLRGQHRRGHAQTFRRATRGEEWLTMSPG